MEELCLSVFFGYMFIISCLSRQYESEKKLYCRDVVFFLIFEQYLHEIILTGTETLQKDMSTSQYACIKSPISISLLE